MKVKTKSELLKQMKKNGYECIAFPYMINAVYWIVKTPNNNIMEIDFYDNDSTLSVKSVSINYKPSLNNGSGCSCLTGEDEYYKSGIINSIEKLRDLELTGLNYAYRLKAKMYNINEIEKVWEQYIANEKGTLLTKE